MSSEDDATVSDDDELLRRVPPNMISRKEGQGTLEVSSAAFTNPSDGSGMSVVIRSALIAGGGCIEEVLAGYEGFGLVSIQVASVREQNQMVVRKPLPENPAHGEVIGQKTRGVRRALKQSAKLIIQPRSKV
ncbi:MAG: hypothetical protein OXH52_13495 [Gammaproteobacteria bacterium]|nr:hypothetical protein [Gammaproteobacteria bacterium]